MILEQIIRKKYFVFAEAFSTWEEAIITGCQPLVLAKVIDHRYAFQIIENVKKYGPYIVITPYVALPHCQENADGVNETAIAFMRVRKPVIFNHYGCHRYAQIFFTLASNNHLTHLRNLTLLANILENQEVISQLRAAENVLDLEKIVQQFS